MTLNKPLQPTVKPARQRHNELNLINRANVKKLVIQYSRERRAGKYTRVSKEFLLRLQRLLDQTILSEVMNARAGKTI